MNLLELISPLNELKMNPTYLEREALKTNALVGMEFEVIIPHSSEYMPEDERLSDFDDIETFFERYLDNKNLRYFLEKINSDYSEWLLEKIKDQWNQGTVYRTYTKNKIDQDFADIRHEAQLVAVKNDLNDDQLDELIDQIYNERLETAIENDIYWNDYKEEVFEDDYAYHQDQWLREQGLIWASDISEEYRLNVIFGADDLNLENLKNTLEEYLSYPILISEFKNENKQAGFYYIESDSSINDPNGNGIEIVSPAMPVGEMLSELNNFKQWAEHYDAYTNHTTGLHMNISLDDFVSTYDQIDYVKLALFLGDEYVLKKFDRIGNKYAGSFLQKLKSILITSPEKISEGFLLLKQNLSNRVRREIFQNINDKYFSFHLRHNRVEFRSPGGDWLKADLSLLKNTLFRFIIALDVAINSSKYQKEYYKKLYKFFSSAKEEETIGVNLFAKYASGLINKQQLKNELQNIKWKKRNLST